MSTEHITRAALACLLFTQASCCFCPGSGLKRRRLTVRVVNEDSTPVRDAEVTIYSDRTVSEGILFSGSREGRTNSRGRFSGTVWTFARIGVLVTEKGYYGTHVWLGLEGTRLHEAWLPYKPHLTIVLRRIIKPIPMYAREFKGVKLPIHDERVGYDMAIGDWVEPHGAGVHADIEFTGRLGKDTRGLAGSSLTMLVPGEGNGLIPIAEGKVYRTGHFRLPRHAPEGDYRLKEVVFNWVASRPPRDRMSSVPEKHFFVRVRTELGSDGEIKAAHYAKLIGPVFYGLSYEKRMGIVFAYCLNPTPNDRNLEWDSEKNLLKGLAPGDEPNVW